MLFIFLTCTIVWLKVNTQNENSFKKKSFNDNIGYKIHLLLLSSMCIFSLNMGLTS